MAAEPVDWSSAQVLFNVALGMLATLFGWLSRELWDAVKQLKDDHAKLREEIANDRVHKHDFSKFTEEVFRKLDRIEDKLGAKADRNGG